ncbi:MAG: glycosyltransferase family 2 protein [Endomicrobiales bacterium]|nr:glycosyltransferase family 2 protein [Endomicrobiales bacterium]
MKATLLNIILVYSYFVLFYFIAINFIYLLLLVIASKKLFYHKARRGLSFCRDKYCALIPDVAIIAPSFNEELTVVESVWALLQVEYPNLEVIVVNDGSKDRTMDVLREKFNLFPISYAAEQVLKTKRVQQVYASMLDERLIVIDKENGGKADALNVGLNYSRSRLFCGIDADTLIEKGALYRIVSPYLERDSKTVAVGGIVRVSNDCKIVKGEVTEVNLPENYLAATQVMEYIRAFLCGRMGWSELDALLIISGAFGLFERKAVMEAGGYRTDIVGEDMELVVRLHRIMRDKKKDYKMVFVPEPVCWTQVPDTLKILSKQRNRWQRGLIESVIYNFGMFFNPKYGSAGVLAMPYFVFFEILGPFVEISGYIVFVLCFLFNWINFGYFALFLAVSIVFGTLLSLYSLLLEEFTVKRYEKLADILRLFALAVLENFGYRQINSWWRFVAMFDFFFKKNRSWGEMARKSYG